jgi:hypothetical protein
MLTPLDSASGAAATAEATYLADLANVAAIQAAIDSTTNPLAPAQAQMATDAATYNTTLDALATAAIAAKVPIPAPATP